MPSINTANSLLAPPTQDELSSTSSSTTSSRDIMAPPSEDELSNLLLAPPTREELGISSGSTINDSDVAAIAVKHGVDPSWLDDQIPILGGRREQMRAGDPVQYVLSIADEAALLGAGKFIYKKLQDDPGKRNAIDDLTSLIAEKKPWQQTAVEIAGGFAVPTGWLGAGAKTLKGAAGAGKLATLGKVARTGAIVGGAAGLTHSREGEELAGAATGAALGAGLGAGVVGTGMGVGLTTKAIRGIKNSIGDTLAGVSDALQDDIISLGVKHIEKHPEAESTIINNLVSDVPKSYEDFYITPTDRSEFLLADDINSTSKLGKKYDRLLRKYGDRLGDIADTGDADDMASRYIYMRLHETADDWARNTGARLTDDMTGMDYIGKRVATDGPEFVSESLRNYRIGEAGRRIIRGSIPTNSESGGLIRRVGLFLMDAPKVANMLDTKYGTAVRRIIDDLSGAYNEFTNKIATVYKDIRSNDMPIFKEVGADRLLQITREIDSKPLTWVENTYIPSLANKSDMDVVNALINRGNKFRDEARELGLPITQLKRGGEDLVYIPNAMLDTPELISTIRKSVDDVITSKYGGDLSKFLDTARVGRGELATNEAQLLKALEITSNQGADGGITSVRDLRKAIDQINREPTRVRANLESMATASHYRAGTIPEFIRDYNPVKLFTRYAHNTYKHAYLREGMSELSNQYNHLVRLGDEQGATWVRNLIGDIQGTREGTARAAMNNMRLRSQLGAIERLRELDSKGATEFSKMLVRGKARMWDVWPALTANMYPYYLGFRPDAVLRNLTQPYQMTAATLGSDVMPSYGLRVTAESQLMVGMRPNIDELVRVGFIPANYSEMAVDDLLGEINRALSHKKGWTRDMIQRAQDFSMWAYTHSDFLNRSVTYKTSQLVTDDFLRGLAAMRSGTTLTREQQAAIAAIRKMPRSYQAQVKEMIRRDQFSELPLTIAKYLNSETQFNYNRISMSEFGRTMGSLFSMFSKWPSAILGDIVEQTMNMKSGNRYKMRDAEVEILHKYLYPIMGAMALEQFMLPSADESPTRRLLLGKSMYQWTNASSVAGLLNGQFGKPPALSALIDATQAAVGGDYKKAARDAIKYGESVTPGSSLLQLIPQKHIMGINETRMDQVLDVIEGR